MLRASFRLGSMSKQFFSTSRIHDIKGSSEFDSFTKQPKTGIVLDFYADWCGPCKNLGPRLEKIIEGNKDWSLLKINVDEPLNTEIMNKYNVGSIPHLVGLKNGETVFNKIGSLPDSEIQKLLK